MAQEFPVRQHFFLVQFRPSLDQALLALGNSSGQQLNGANRKDRRILLIIGMKVRHVVPLRWFDKHPNDNAIKTTKLRHRQSFATRAQVSKT